MSQRIFPGGIASESLGEFFAFLAPIYMVVFFYFGPQTRMFQCFSSGARIKQHLGGQKSVVRASVQDLTIDPRRLVGEGSTADETDQTYGVVTSAPSRENHPICFGEEVRNRSVFRPVGGGQRSMF